MKVITAIEVICVICVIMYLIYDKIINRHKIINSPTTQSPLPLHEGIKAEVDEALEQIFLFRNENSFLKKELGLLMLFPVNSTGEPDFQGDYIKIKLSIYQKLDDWFFSYAKPKYLSDFNFVVENGLEYIEKRTICSFLGLHYEEAMSQLYEHLVSKYPEYNWELDGYIRVFLNNGSI